MAHSAAEVAKLLGGCNEHCAVLICPQDGFFAVFWHVFLLRLDICIDGSHLLVGERVVVYAGQGDVASKHGIGKIVVSWVIVSTQGIEGVGAKCQRTLDSLNNAAQDSIDEEFHCSVSRIPHTHKVNPFVCNGLGIVDSIKVGTLHVRLEIINTSVDDDSDSATLESTKKVDPAAVELAA